MPGTRTLIAAALAGTIALGTLAGAAIPANMKSSAAPDWRETYRAAPAMDGQDYYVEPAPQDLAPPMATTSWLYSSPGAAREDVALIPYAYDDDELADEDTLPVGYDPAEPAPSENASADQQASAAQEVAEEVKQAEAEAAPRPATAS
ncbi:hypothetical protein [Novosphingobium sp. AP12]|uniref:hypothetical protein n=1 Tax=Novosphingobium sp. AP12 TaxID=1144305 RepID=UPI000272103A|nr:hypothetical protein [Novosphingobium sp. AP12]EJL24028.1 hypothetical protein PMI02_03949 [Novosphingobium sp. AP12]